MRLPAFEGSVGRRFTYLSLDSKGLDGVAPSEGDVLLNVQGGGRKRFRGLTRLGAPSESTCGAK